jgi:hypothetical protein
MVELDREFAKPDVGGRRQVRQQRGNPQGPATNVLMTRTVTVHFS